VRSSWQHASSRHAVGRTRKSPASAGTTREMTSNISATRWFFFTRGMATLIRNITATGIPATISASL